MPDYTDATQSSLSDLDNVERYTLHNGAEIRTQLLALARQPDILTAYFNEGRNYILTAVLGVIEERGLLVLDYGPDEESTRAAIASGRLVCTTRHHGIPIRFSCDSLQSARYKALPAIATPIPDSMYRMQRREFFRVTTPKINGPRCDVELPGSGQTLQLTVLDISLGGMGLLDTSGTLQLEVGQVLESCHIVVPHHGEIKVQLEIRNKGIITSAQGDRQQRYGVAFGEMGVGDNTHLQRYIFQLQTQQLK